VPRKALLLLLLLLACQAGLARRFAYAQQEYPAARAPADSGPAFCYHGAYNTQGNLFANDRQGYLDYVDEHLRQLGVQCLRHSGTTGLVPRVVDDPERGWRYLDEAYIHGAGIVGDEQLVTVWFSEREEETRTLEILEHALARYDGDCDLNDDGDCQDTVQGVPERQGINYPFIRYYQAGNELGGKKDPFGQDSGDYAEFASKAAVMISNRCPSCKVLLGSVLGSSDESWERRRDYFEEILASLQAYDSLHMFDAADIHLPNIERINYTTYRAMAVNWQDVRGLLDSFGLEDRSIWCTETSTYTDRPWTMSQDSRYPYHSEVDQAADLVKRYLYYFSLGIERVHWSPNLIDRRVEDGQKAVYWSTIGLITSDGQKKVSFGSMKIMVDKLSGLQTVERIDLGDPNLYLFRFGFGASVRPPVHVLWNEEGTVTVDLSAKIAGNVKVTTIKGRVTQEPVDAIAISMGPKFIETVAETTHA
jgi:hypothetical protein